MYNEISITGQPQVAFKRSCKGHFYEFNTIQCYLWRRQENISRSSTRLFLNISADVKYNRSINGNYRSIIIDLSSTLTKYDSSKSNQKLYLFGIWRKRVVVPTKWDVMEILYKRKHLMSNSFESTIIFNTTKGEKNKKQQEKDFFYTWDLLQTEKNYCIKALFLTAVEKIQIEI